MLATSAPKTPLPTVTNRIIDDDEIIITPQTSRPKETLHIQGSDRRYPCIVKRNAYWFDRSRSIISTISKKGKYAHIYPAYQGIITNYLARTGRIITPRRDNDSSLSGVAATWNLYPNTSTERIVPNSVTTGVLE